MADKNGGYDTGSMGIQSTQGYGAQTQLQAQHVSSVMGNGGSATKTTPFKALVEAAGATGLQGSIGPTAIPRDVSMGGGTDLSRNIFQVGKNTRVGDFLRAIPKVFGRPVASAGNATGDLYVPVQRVSGAAASPVVLYNGASASLATGYDTLSAAVEYKIARLGLSVSVPKIDAIAAPSFTAGNQAAWRLQAASAEIVRQLNMYLTEGTGGEAPVPAFKGLAQLCTDAGRELTAGAKPIDYYAQFALGEINPTDRGEGAGPTCLLGGMYAMRALMKTTAGQTGLSGWRFDARVGRTVYHFMGVPFYRIYEDSDTDAEGSAPTTLRLFAANFGPTGLALVHAYGTVDTMGLQIDEESTSATTASQRYTVHGAYALVPWENEAIYAVNGITVSW